jgi:hypothetical protein
MMVYPLLVDTVIRRSRAKQKALKSTLEKPFARIIAREQNSTLALIHPPGLFGGYRNQVIRLTTFSAYARIHNFSHLLLPSLSWSTQVNEIGQQRIPMDWVFDVDHWNSYSDHLPVLAADIENSDCWQTPQSVVVHSDPSLIPLQRAVLELGGLEPLGRFTRNESSFERKSQDLLPLVEHCRHPVAYGGGKKAGRLWADYGRYRTDQSTNGTIPFEQDKYITLALRPTKQWRDLADQCVQGYATTGQYLALHARVELDMMAHKCGRNMEHNLTKIIRNVEVLTNTLSTPISGIFIAVSREFMEKRSGQLYRKLKKNVDENLETLNGLVGYNNTPRVFVGDKKLQGFQCGQRLVEKYYSEHPDVPDHGSILAAVIDFDVAVNAAVFVGVRGSSFSVDVWTTRFHQGRGASNYEYTKEGIQAVDNGGLPTPHVNCKK